MAKIIPITEHFQHFLAEMKESFWGDLYGQTRQAWQQFFELQSERQRDRFSGWGRYERRRGKRRVYRNGGMLGVFSHFSITSRCHCNSIPQDCGH